MNRKKVLEKRMARLMAKKQKLSERCNASNDVNEVRDLTTQLEDVNAEIAETQEEIDAIKQKRKCRWQAKQEALFLLMQHL